MLRPEPMFGNYTAKQVQNVVKGDTILVSSDRPETVLVVYKNVGLDYVQIRTTGDFYFYYSSLTDTVSVVT